MPRNSTSFSPVLTAIAALAIVFSVSPALNAADRRFRLGPGLDEPAPESKPATDGFHFDHGEWNKARDGYEEEERRLAEPVVVRSSDTPAPPKPPPGIISVELPYESALSVTGRKVIKLDIQNTHISAERAQELNSKQDTQTFTMEQELQARIQGTVARKTTINVNFDDTKENVRDFSIVYKGDPGEVVQEAAFGDIVLSLPSTEFVNYNKQLFGVRAALKYKRAEIMAIGSRTKGTTETKRFTGSTTRQQIFVNDTAYIRRRYYDLTFATAPLVSGGGGIFAGHQVLPISDALAEEVYFEDTTGLIPEPIAQDLSIASPTSPTANPVTIRMRQLARGVDYSIDRLRGIITFVNPIPEDVRVAVDFTLADGARLSSLVAGGTALLIKDKSPENAVISQEIKRFYSMGAKNVIRDNGLGNFVFKVLDNNRKDEIGDGLSPRQRYPDTIDVNFEQGIFELDQKFGFTDLYDTNVNAGTPLHAVFSLEYQAILRTYTLKPNIVLQSEKVEVNGRKLSRDVDYFIDYDIGILTFFNEDLIRESSVIDVTYEFAPFGGQLGETLVGARTNFDLMYAKNSTYFGAEKWTAGSTVLYNFAAKPTAPPDVRSTPASLLVTEGDTQLKGLRFGKLDLKTDIAFETAKSVSNPNLFGKAIVDSMEGIKQDDSASMLEQSWQVAANPQFGTHNTVTDFRGREEATSHLQWREGDAPTLDPNDGSATQKALSVSYSLNNTNAVTPEQVSMIQPISLVGRDFSKKTTLEVEVVGAGAQGAGVDLIIEYGSFNEDSDGDGLLDTEDANLDGLLNLGEDTGWVYNGPGNDLSIASTADNTTTGVGANNTRLDAEDLNQDRVLSTQDNPATFQPLFRMSNGLTDNLGQFSNDLNFTDRRLFQIPINVAALSAEEKARLTAVKQVRVTIRNTNPATTARVGTLSLARISISGNTWEPAVTTDSGLSTMTVKAINNKDDAGIYTPLFGNGDYNDLYKGVSRPSDAKEQALNLTYTILPGVEATSRNLFSAPRDFAKHKSFRYFVTKRNTCSSACGEFFLRAGSETDYQQAKIDIANIPTTPNWLVIQLEQVDRNKDGTPDTWVSKTSGVTVTQVGSVPNLTQVSQLKAGVKNSTTTTIQNEVWLNEIHVAEPNVREGYARRFAADSVWAGWMDFGGAYRDVDRNWETPTTVITNQDRTQSNAYMNISRLPFLPMTFKTNRDVTVTPSAFRSNSNALVSFLDEGRVESLTNNYTAKLILPRLPVFDFAYDSSRLENTVTQRRELRDTGRVAATYAPTRQVDVLPGRYLTLRPVPTNITINYSRSVAKLRFPGQQRLIDFGISTTPFNSTNLTQFTDEREVRLAFAPWDGFSFNPAYKLKTDTEKRDFRGDEIQSLAAAATLDGRRTPRAMAQSLSTSGGLKLTSWLNPSYNYSFTGTETNGLPTLSNTTGYTVKTITRNSQGEVSTSIQMQQLLPRSRLLNSMNLSSSYKLEAGDTYNDMPEGFKWRSHLWAGRALIGPSTSTVARRVEATERKTFRGTLSWIPFSMYQMPGRLKPFNTLSLTNNYQTSIEDSETTGTGKHVESVTSPDLVLTMNETEKFFGWRRVSSSRLTLKSTRRGTVTRSVSESKSSSYGTDYQFQWNRRLDWALSYNTSDSRDDNLISRQLIQRNRTRGYAAQVRIPRGVWAYTPRYERNQTDTRDSARVTNDLVSQIHSLQIYGDIARPIGLRFGRREIGLANRLIVNSTLKWEKNRSTINPATNYIDIYSGTLSGDYTISQNFRMAIGGNYSQEVHEKNFKKFDRTVYGLNTTITIQF